MLTCKDEPAVPEAVDDGTVARFIADLADAGADCRTKVRALRAWFGGSE